MADTTTLNTRLLERLAALLERSADALHWLGADENGTTWGELAERSTRCARTAETLWSAAGGDRVASTLARQWCTS